MRKTEDRHIMKICKCLIIIILFLRPVFAEPADKQSNTVDAHFYVSGGAGVAHFSNNIFNWSDDYSSEFLEKAASYDSSYSNCHLHDEKYIKTNPMINISFSSDIYYKNCGLGLSVKNNYYAYSDDLYGHNPDDRCYDYLSVRSTNISPSLLIRTNAIEFGEDRIIHFFGGIGIDYVILHYKYHIGGDFPPVGAKTKEFRDSSLGWHVSAGINYDYGLLGLFSELTYTHVHFDSIKEKNGSDVMRYSDGRKVSTSIDTVVLSVGAGLHIGW
jgi:hypothetical protein